MKIAKSFKFSKQVIAALDFLTRLTGIGVTATIEKLIIDEAIRLGWDGTEIDANVPT